MKTGFSRACITPNYSTPLAGYYQERYSNGVLDDIYATAVAFDDGTNKALLIELDILALPEQESLRFTNAVADALSIPKEAVIVTCSHTHTAPVVGYYSITNTPDTPKYTNFLEEQIIKAGKEAIDDLADSELGFASGEVKNISFTRRFLMKDGTVATNPGVGNPDIVKQLGDPDESLRLVKIARNGKDDIFIVNFAVHPDTVGGEKISSDYQGFVRDTLENAIPGVKCVYISGALGDVNHINVNPTEAEREGLNYDTFDDVPRGYEHTKHMGRAIAGAVLAVCGKTEKVKTDKIKSKSIKIRVPSNKENDKLEESQRILDLHNSGRDDCLPYTGMYLTTVVATAKRIVDMSDGPDYFELTLSTFSIGDLVFVALPGEPFTQIGQTIIENSPYKYNIIASLCYEGHSYFPDTKAFEEGGYEPGSCPMKKGVAEIITDSVTEMLNNL